MIDGDTIEVAGERVCLHGAAAPEKDTSDGWIAKKMMRRIVVGQQIRCRDTGERSHGRTSRDETGAIRTPNLHRFYFRPWRLAMALASA